MISITIFFLLVNDSDFDIAAFIRNTIILIITTFIIISICVIGIDRSF